MEEISREYNINYNDCVGSIIYILSVRVYLCLAVNKFIKFLSNIGNVHFEGLLHLLRYIWDNNSLGLRYYSQIEDAPLSELFIHSIIHTDNQLMMFSNCI